MERSAITRRTSSSVIAAGILAILVAACATASADSAAMCDAAVAQAMAIDPDSDTVSALDGAIARCPSLEAWVAAARHYPDTTAGQDPAAYALTRCATSSQVEGSEVCDGLTGQ